MTITRADVADLQPGDVVELRYDTDPDTVTRGPLRVDPNGSLRLAGEVIRHRDGSHWNGHLRLVTVVSRAPRPLYVNHPRTEPLMNDVARDPGEGYTSRIWIFDGFDWWFPNGDTVVMVTTDDMPKPMRLLVDGETGLPPAVQS